MSDKKIPKKKPKNLHDGHRERMRGKFIEFGLDVFSDHEVIEKLLYYVVPRKNTNELAHKMLNEFGTIYDLFNAHTLDIQRRTGISEGGAVLFSMMPHLFKRYKLSENEEKMKFESSCRLGEFIKVCFIGKVYESFFVMCLNGRLEVIAHKTIQEGTLDVVQLNMRDILEFVIRHKAKYIVLAHNHPSGDPTPSQADLNATVDISQILKKFDIDVIDHFLITSDNYVSFAEHGYLDKSGIVGIEEFIKRKKKAK